MSVFQADSNAYMANIQQLQASIDALCVYQQTIGRDSDALEHLKHQLKHRDPFIVYEASQKAKAVLSEGHWYH